jgi:hypothetical protein
MNFNEWISFFFFLMNEWISMYVCICYYLLGYKIFLFQIDFISFNIILNFSTIK